MHRTFVTALLLVLVLTESLSASAQQRRVPLPPPPVEFALEKVARDEPFVRVLSFRASATTDFVADRRLLYFEVRAPGTRRVHQCQHPDRPSRALAERTIHLNHGERSAEWIDLREYCWGAALRALRAGAELTGFYRALPPLGERQQGSRGIAAPILGPVREEFEAVSEPIEPEPSAPIRIVLRDSDARRARDLRLNVRVVARDARVRAYLRSDHVRFRVRGPEGTFDCGMLHGEGAAPADLFGWLTRRSGPQFSLDPSFYCADSFRAPGVYEVIPMIDITQGGERWGFNTPTGTFVGAPALVRIRQGDLGYAVRGEAHRGGGP